MATTHLQIVTPQGISFDDDIQEVIIPGIEGELGILPNHTSLLTEIQPGELRVKKADRWQSLATGTGFVEINPDSIKILTDMSLSAEEISEKEVEEAKKRAEEALKNKEVLSDEEFAVTASALQKALAQLKVKRRHHQSQKSPTESSL